MWSLSRSSSCSISLCCILIGCCCLLGLLLFCCCVAPLHVMQDGISCFVLCHWRWGECGETTFDTECTWVYANTTRTETHWRWATPFILTHKHKHTCTPRAPIWAPWQQYKKQRCQMCFPVFPVLRICSACVEKGKGSCAHTHIQLQARNTLGCWIMRVDRAELSLHITIILSFSQLPQHLPWRCDISILLEFNLGPLNKTIAYRPFPNGPSPILITWN